MKRLVATISIFFILIDISFPAGDSFSFEFKKRDVIVYSKKLPGVLKEFYSSTVIDVDRQRLVEILENFSSYSSWHDEFYYSELVESRNDGSIYYQIINCRFPFKKREVFLERKILSNNNSTVIRFNSLWHKKYPVTKAYVRITNFYGEWILSDYMDGNRTIVVYRIKRDFAGDMPSFLINRTNAFHAFSILESLKSYVVKNKN